MNDTSNTAPPESPAEQADRNQLKAETYDDFYEALDILYISGNLSGRLHFSEAWPAAAQFLFGDDLMGYDRDGTNNVDHRVALEEEAEERRLALLNEVENLEQNSVNSSVLQIEYVQKLVERLDRDMALLIYSPKIVDRFLEPPVEVVPAPDDVAEGAAVADVPAAPAEPVDPPSVVQPVSQPVSQPVVEPISKPAPQAVPEPSFDSRPSIQPLDDDAMDAVQPISLEPPPQAQDAAPTVPIQEPPMPPMPDSFAAKKADAVDSSSSPISAPGEPLVPSPEPKAVVKESSAAQMIKDMKPVATQKMTFMPSKPVDAPKADEAKPVPVISPTKSDSPQD